MPSNGCCIKVHLVKVFGGLQRCSINVIKGGIHAVSKWRGQLAQAMAYKHINSFSINLHSPVPSNVCHVKVHSVKLSWCLPRWFCPTILYQDCFITYNEIHGLDSILGIISNPLSWCWQKWHEMSMPSWSVGVRKIFNGQIKMEMMHCYGMH